MLGPPEGSRFYCSLRLVCVFINGTKVFLTLKFRPKSGPSAPLEDGLGANKRLRLPADKALATAAAFTRLHLLQIALEGKRG